MRSPPDPDARVRAPAHRVARAHRKAVRVLVRVLVHT